MTMTGACRIGTCLATIASASVLAGCGQPAEPPAPAAPVVGNAINSVWHQAKLRGVAFRAIGQEPGWLLESIDGEALRALGSEGKVPELDFGEV